MYHTGVSHTCTRILREPRHGRGRRVRGFTLVELMVTIAVAAILITIAVPSFQHIIASNKLTSTANTLVSALHVARMQAIKRNADAQFCSNDPGSNGGDVLGPACANHTGAVYVLTGVGAGTAVQVRAATSVAQGPQQLDGNVTALRFDARGVAHLVGQAAPYGGQVADICTTVMDSNNHRIVEMATGTIIHVKTTSGACP